MINKTNSNSEAEMNWHMIKQIIPVFYNLTVFFLNQKLALTLPWNILRPASNPDFWRTDDCTVHHQTHLILVVAFQNASKLVGNQEFWVYIANAAPVTRHVRVVIGAKGKSNHLPPIVPLLDNRGSTSTSKVIWRSV